jgi:hypothetical protein
MSDSFVLRLVIGTNDALRAPWGLAEVLTGEQATGHFREFLEEYGLPQFAYDPAVTLVRITHRDPTGSGNNHFYGLRPLAGVRPALVHEALLTSIDQPHWEIMVDRKMYVTLDNPAGLRKLRESLETTARP